MSLCRIDNQLKQVQCKSSKKNCSSCKEQLVIMLDITLDCKYQYMKRLSSGNTMALCKTNTNCQLLQSMLYIHCCKLSTCLQEYQHNIHLDNWSCMIQQQNRRVNSLCKTDNLQSLIQSKSGKKYHNLRRQESVWMLDIGQNCRQTRTEKAKPKNIVDLSRRDTEWCFHQNKFCTENCKLHSSDSQHQCSIHRDKLTRKHVRLCLDKEIHCKSGTESIGLLSKLCRLCRRLDTEELELETCIG